MTEPCAWHRNVPKVELHLHLEGAIPLEALWQLLEKYGGDPDVPDLAALRSRFVFTDFGHFINIWSWKTRYMRDSEDFALVGEAVARELARQNIRYVEAFCSPPGARKHGLSPQEVIVGLRRGLERVPEVEVWLVPDLERGHPVDVIERMLDQVHEVMDQGIIGIGMGGPEAGIPAAPYAGVYEQARRWGLHTTIHAGESAGPENVWEAIRALRVERIGHGIRAIDDPELVACLARERIPLEVCPLSNLRTAVVDDIAQHPVRRLHEAGVRVTINTDDPAMFNNSLAEEYALLEGELGFSRDEVRELILEGIRASWMPEARKAEMLAEFQSDPAW